jgi:hypothetical protein
MDQAHSKPAAGVDKSLVAMFLKMTPEERLRANDSAANTILELRDAFRQRCDRGKSDRAS